ncbi:MAG: hypothetical protein AAB074_20660 [Planctomycetota bacterium]
MNIRKLAAAVCLIAVVSGCSSPPLTMDQTVDATHTVLRRHYTKIESSEGGSDQRVVTTCWQELAELKERERWQATATITVYDDEEDPSVDIVVMRQNDESDTGYGERSPSNPKWGLATRYQDEERKLSDEIQKELQPLRR